MAKGINKIEYIDNNRAKEAVRNIHKEKRIIILKADKSINFYVYEWFIGTSEEDKTRDITWLLLTKDRKYIKRKENGNSFNYPFKITAKESGEYFYLEASLSGEPDKVRKVGYYIKGYSKNLIINSAWSISEKPNDVRKTHNFRYGESIFLYIDAEGLYGSEVSVEVYRKTSKVKSLSRFSRNKNPFDDDIFVYEKKVICNDGNINIEFSPSETIKWKDRIKDLIKKEEFYVRVKNKKGDYVPDNNKDTVHARYLRILDETVKDNTTDSISSILNDIKNRIPTNTTPTKIGKAEEKTIEYAPCKLKKIDIIENEKVTNFFDEGLIKSKMDSNKKYYTIRKIFFDFNKYSLQIKSYNELNELADFLQRSQGISIEIAAHADERGNDQYNDILTQKRAETVVNYLEKQGIDPRRMRAKGYGKRTPAIPNAITEVEHAQNRRTTMAFLIFENDSVPIMYQTIVPYIAKWSSESQKEIKLIIHDFSRKGCFKRDPAKKEYHSRELKIVDSKVNIINPQTLKDGYNEVIFNLHSAFSEDLIARFFQTIIAMNPRFGNDISKGFSSEAEIYKIYLHSCAYYSSVDKPTLAIEAFPDARTVYHFKYNYSEDFYFHNIKVNLINNYNMIKSTMEYIVEKIEQALEKAMETKIMTWLFSDDNRKFIVNYFTRKIKDLLKLGSVSLGMHVLHNFKSFDDKSPDNIDYSTKYGTFTLATTWVLSVLVELLIVYVSKGRLEKAEKAIKEVNEGLKLNLLNTAVNAGVYYKKNEKGRIEKIQELNLRIKPLIGIKYAKSMYDFILPKDDNESKEQTKERKEAAKIIKDYYGDNIDIKFGLVGDINIEYAIRLNHTSRIFSVLDGIKENAVTNGGMVLGIEGAIGFKLELYINETVERTFKLPNIKTYELSLFGDRYIPIPIGVKKEEYTVTAEGKVYIGINGSISIIERVGIEKLVPFREKNLIFSGIKAIIEAEVKATIQGNDGWNTKIEKKIEKREITIIPGFNIDMSRVPL